MLQQASPLYRECLKNHAVRIGSIATDGCREFMACGDDGTLEALNCAACGCHQNFHRKEQLANKKRHRTLFTVEQKEKMAMFAEKVGWRIPREDAELHRFCGEVGVKQRCSKFGCTITRSSAAKKPLPQQQDQMGLTQSCHEFL